MHNFSLSRIILTFILLILIFIFSPFNFTKTNDNFFDNKIICKALVENVTSSNSDTNSKVKLIISEGKYKGKEFTLENTLVVNDSELKLKSNDFVQVLIETDSNGNLNAQIYNYYREKTHCLLVSFFILLVLIIGGIKGLYSILSIFFNICIIYMILLPGLLSGYNPIKLTIICCLFISFFSLFIQDGFNKKTISCLIGTIGGVLIAGIVTHIMNNSLHVSINSEEFTALTRYSQNIQFDFQGILFSSIVIGALGANLDMSMSIATSMNEIKESNPNIPKQLLIKSGLSVGRDVIGTMSNTLILAYVGSALVSLMIFLGYNINFSYIINLQDIYVEILRSLAGSIGIILSVPLTVFTRAYMK
ncbi:YibE/F family protein [Clostridium sp. LQ25]|uniref:YibE/F family protein n=1 Tax=Clostridium TaxID=1485 RepID=UPI0022594490|nr:MULTISPECIES: YibE/F family protein [Clostridium]MDB2161052.1 YibE/F family protein [Clostridium butyricum]MDU1604181.1 YibE/F family protein [Clostridium sp.]UZT08565.1 YibE/F family protein [Clostridium sp. LQ25]